MVREQNLLMIREQIEIVDYETEILPGIKTISAPGHTPGHMALIISSADEQLLCTFDIVHYPFQLVQPDWHFFFDTLPEQAMQTRRKLLNRAEIDKVLVWACHFPYPGLGYIVRNNETWSWQPAEIIDTATGYNAQFLTRQHALADRFGHGQNWQGVFLFTGKFWWGFTVGRMRAIPIATIAAAILFSIVPVFGQGQ